MRRALRWATLAAVGLPLALVLALMAAGGLCSLAELRDEAARAERRLARMRLAFGDDLSAAGVASSVARYATATAVEAPAAPGTSDTPAAPAAPGPTVAPRTTGGLPLLHLDGPPYVRGFAQGYLARAAARGVLVDLMSGFDAFAAREGAASLARRWGWEPGGVGERALRIVARLPGVLPLVRRRRLGDLWARMAPHVPVHVMAEVEGLADGADVPEERVRRLLMVSELTSAGCSSVACFGDASVDGRLRQFRNLDWNLGTHLQRFPLLVEHAPAQGRRAFVSLGFGGFPFVLQGANDAGLTLAEIGAGSRVGTYAGQPMVVRLRRVLEEAVDLAGAARVVMEGSRTKGYNFVIGSSAEGRALAFETNHERVAAFRDDDERERANPYAFPVPGAVLRGDFAVDPVLRASQRAADGPGDPRGADSYRARYQALGEALRARDGRPLGTGDMLELARLAGRPSENLVSVVYAPDGISVSYASDDVRACERPYAFVPWARLRWVHPVFADVRRMPGGAAGSSPEARPDVGQAGTMKGGAAP